jgi:hypothetical protein
VSDVLLRLNEAQNNSKTHNLARREEDSLVTGILNEQQILLGRILDELLQNKEITSHLSRRDSDLDVLVGIPPPAQDLPEHARFSGTRLPNPSTPPAFARKYHHKELISCPVTFRQIVGRLIVHYSCVPDFVAHFYGTGFKKGDQARRQALCFMYYFPTWLCTRERGMCGDYSICLPMVSALLTIQTAVD